MYPLRLLIRTLFALLMAALLVFTPMAATSSLAGAGFPQSTTAKTLFAVDKAAFSVASSHSIEGLQRIGRGEDLLSVLGAAGAAELFQFSCDHFPGTTAALVAAAAAVGEQGSLVVSWIDERTGKVVSKTWNDLPQDVRDGIVGGTKVVTFIIPAGAAAKIAKAVPEVRVATGSLTNIVNYVDLTGSRRVHILNGHLNGAGKSGKTEFPANWDADRIMHQVSDVASDPNSIRGLGKWNSPYVVGMRDGIEIRVDFYPNLLPNGLPHPNAGKISTAYPTNTPVNP